MRKEVLTLLVGSSLITNIVVLVPSLTPYFVHSFEPFVYHGIDVVRFSTGPWFKVHIGIAIIYFALSVSLCLHVFIKEKGIASFQAMLLFLSTFLSMATDIYLVYTNSPLRWTMIAMVTFLIVFVTIIFASYRYNFLNIFSLSLPEIFKHFPDPVLVIDQEHSIWASNKSANKVFKINGRGKRLVKDVFPSLNLEATSFEYELDVQDKVRFFNVNIKPVKKGMVVVGHILFFKDVTSLKEAEGKLKNHLKFQDQLLTLIAHDMAGNFQSQLQITSWIKDSIDDRESAEVLYGSIESTKELMDNILSWSKLLAQNFTPLKNKIELNSLISQAVNSVNATKAQKKILIRHLPSAPFIELLGDAEMILSALRNILNNAIKACGEEGEIDVTSKILPDQKVEVIIQDNGKGVDPQKLSHLQDIFNNPHLDSETNRFESSSGYGIGLNLVKRFLAYHQGEVRISSVLNEGTRFSFSLPIVEPCNQL